MHKSQLKKKKINTHVTGFVVQGHILSNVLFTNLLWLVIYNFAAASAP